MSDIASDWTAVMSEFGRWPIRDHMGAVVGQAASPESAAYLESSTWAVEVRVINHA